MSLTSVGKMIENAFKDEFCKVHFKLIHMILTILAKQMRLLDRRVPVELGDAAMLHGTGSQLSVTEIKLKGKKKKKNKIEDDIFSLPSSSSSSGQNLSGKTELDRKLRKSEKNIARLRKKKGDKSMESSSETTIDSGEKRSGKDYQQEKLIIVESLESMKRGKGHGPKSVVILEQFEDLVERVVNLQKIYGVQQLNDDDFGINMSEFRKEHTLSDPMALIQLSARLEQAEKNLENMIALLTELCNRPTGAKAPHKETVEGDKKQMMSSAPPVPPPPPVLIRKIPIQELKKGKGERGAKTGIDVRRKVTVDASREIDLEEQSKTSVDIFADDTPLTQKPKKIVDYSNFVDLDDLMSTFQDFYDEMQTTAGSMTKKALGMSLGAESLAKRLSQEILGMIEMGVVVDKLEDIVNLFADRVNNIDSNFTELMTEYQEELTAMQYDVEVGLDNMAESLAGQTGDPEAVADMNYKLALLSMELNKTRSLQGDLGDAENDLAGTLKSIWLQLRVLNQTKCNRDEISEKLKVKAGINELNGIMTTAQFDAVRGDLQTRIRRAYETFNNTESTWQKKLDDLTRQLNDKAETQQVDFVLEDIIHNKDKIQERIDFIMNLVGGVHKQVQQKYIQRHENCISCSLPAGDLLSIPVLKPLPPIEKRAKTIGAEKGDDDVTRQQDDGICYPKTPIRHFIDPRGKFCTKICGGKLPKHAEPTPSASPSTMMVFGTPLYKEEIPTQVFTKPCIPCKLPPPLPIVQKLAQQECVPSTCDCGYPDPGTIEYVRHITPDYPKDDCKQAPE